MRQKNRRRKQNSHVCLNVTMLKCVEKVTLLSSIHSCGQLFSSNFEILRIFSLSICSPYPSIACYFEYIRDGTMICKRSALVLLRQLRVVERRRVALIPNQATIGLPINLATRRFNSLNSKDTKPLDSAKTTTPVAEKKEEAKKLTLWEKVKHEAHHYWSGTKLLGFEIKVATKLLVRMLSGYELTRREYQQLKRTIVDVLRLVPFSAFVLIPFAELLLPIALKIFPNLLPSTYESNVDKEKKRAKLLETRAKTSSFLRNTIQESNNLMKLPVQISEDEKFAFVEFFRKINIVDERPTDEQIVKVARLFKDDEVLDNLSRPQLVAMAKYMALTPFGTDTFIRYQIRTKLINVVQDDRAIRYEGVDSLSVLELKAACRSRGLKNIDVSPGRLRDDLNTWLELRLNQKIPSTLLILSSIYTYGQSEVNSYYDALLHVLSSIPDEVYDVAKAGLSDDYKVKLNILKEQQEKIQEEHEQEKQMDAAPVKDHKNVKDVEEPKPEQVEESKASEEAQKDKKA